MILISFLGGDNFNTNPINLQLWTAFVGVLVVRKQLQQERLAESKLIEKKHALATPASQQPYNA